MVKIWIVHSSGAELYYEVNNKTKEDLDRGILNTYDFNRVGLTFETVENRFVYIPKKYMDDSVIVVGE